MTASRRASEPAPTSPSPRGPAHALDGLGGQRVNGLGVLGQPRRIDDRVDVTVPAQRLRGVPRSARPSRFSVPPGRSDTAAISPRSSGPQRPAARHHRHHSVAHRQRRCDLTDESEQVRLIGRKDGHDAGRLGRRERQVLRGHGVDPPSTALQLVGPAREVHESVHGAPTSVRAAPFVEPLLEPATRTSSLAARLQHLGGAVEICPRL